jgi:selenocysteine-specific elongation factor
MGVPGIVVAITKTDAVEQDFADLVVEEVLELLEPTPYGEAQVVQVSAATGAGLDDLRSLLMEEARGVAPHDVKSRPFREVVDRVFSLTGAGTVVTGTSLWGAVEVGDEVEIYPSRATARIRRLHVHGSEQQRVEAGERVAVNLVGLATADLSRGDQLLSKGPWEPTRLVTVKLELLGAAPKPLDEGDEVEVHALASRVAARVERLGSRPLVPGGTSVAQLGLKQPLLLFPEDRLVLRRPSPVNTFAGGIVLDGHLRRWQRKDSARLNDLPMARRNEWPEVLASWIERAGLAAPSAAELAGRMGVLESAVEAPLGRLVSDQRIHCLGTRPARMVMTAELDHLVEAAGRELKSRLSREEVSAGIPARDFMGTLLPRSAEGLEDAYLEELRNRGVVDVAGGRVVPPGGEDHMTELGAELSRKVDREYRDAGLAPPSPNEVAERLAARPAMVEGICQFLVQKNRLARLEGKLLIHRSVLDEVAERIGKLKTETLSVGEFKDEFGLSRKLAIPILEWLDSQRVTVRQGNVRKIIRR